MTKKLLHPAVVALIALSSCSVSQKRINPDEVTAIQFYLMAKDIEFSHGVYSLNRLRRLCSKDTLVTDRATIESYIFLVNRLIPKGDYQPHDFRAASIIIMNNGKEHCLCFGEKTGVVFDDSEMEDSQPLFCFIDEKIYTLFSWSFWWLNETEKEEEIKQIYQLIEQGVYEKDDSSEYVVD